jgi:hypothetical protein
MRPSGGNAPLHHFTRRRVDGYSVAAPALEVPFNLRNDVRKLIGVGLHFNCHVRTDRPESGRLILCERIDSSLAHPGSIGSIDPLKPADRKARVRTVGVSSDATGGGSIRE